MCKCDKCKADVAAYTLNRLHPPAYVASSQGELYARLTRSAWKRF